MPKYALDYESVDKGTPLDGLTIPALTRISLARFAGAIDEYNPLHLDDRVAMATGKSSVFASSNMLMAYVGRMVEAWFVGASLRRYGLRMLKLVWPGDVLTCRGVIIDKRLEDGDCVIDADVWADNQRGETVAKGRVLAVVPQSKTKGLTKAQAAIGVVYPVGSVKRIKTADESSEPVTAAPSKAVTTKKPARAPAAAKSSGKTAKPAAKKTTNTKTTAKKTTAKKLTAKKSTTKKR